ncbi:unnamed protein product [Ceratitis capitata]|uniref:(Mediterranean fruit fly) hypothetical protein n=1 Tax=Ceratitis capitata TaxID=7213 RepID=A0A811TYM3_CERCA|nr:unnamed protein product [Ceratitis capitata]
MSKAEVESDPNILSTNENGTAAPTGNDNGLTIPEWITAELFVDLLKEKLPEFREIRNFKAKPAVAPGENYATIMLNIEIEISTQSDKEKKLSYMMKIPIDSMRDLMRKFNVFDVESSMYQVVVPEMEQMFRDAGVEVKFGAEYYNINTPSEFGVILLEDLRQYGFKNVDRLEGLDMEHTKCVLRKLAQWHAASATRVQTKGPYCDDLMNGFFTDEHFEMMKQINENLGNMFLSCAKTFEGNGDYIESLEKFNAHYFDKFFRAGKTDPSAFNVLNHGDCWSNNVMFQHDTFGKVKETYFVDYQIPKYGTPAQDLYYALISSTNFDVKLKHFDYFIKFYHDNLVENLTLLKYPLEIPTLKDLHIMLHKHNIWAYSTMTGVMAAVLLDPTDKANLESLIGESEAGNDFKRQLYTNKRYQKHARVILPWLLNRGVLEC